LLSGRKQKQDILAQIVRGLNYDERTNAVLIRELERLFGGAEAEISLASVDLFKGPKVLLTSLDSVRTFRVKLAAYRTTLETHWQRATEFAPNSHLYREIIFSKFTQTDLIHFQEQKATKMRPTSPDGFLAWLDLRQSALEATDIGVRAKTTTQPTVIESLNTAFLVTENPQEIEYDDVLQEAAIDKQMNFIVDEDTPPHIVEQVLNIRHNTGWADYVKIVACDLKGK
jgi:hypothetical protein